MSGDDVGRDVYQKCRISCDVIIYELSLCSYFLSVNIRVEERYWKTFFSGYKKEVDNLRSLSIIPIIGNNTVLFS